MWFSGKEKSKVADSITIILNILVKVACYSHLFLRQNTMVEMFLKEKGEFQLQL